MDVKEFIDSNYFHFNARELKEAARAYVHLLHNGGEMMVTLAGAMSTARLGISLAEMIRRGHIHAICCTGANIEEDLYRLLRDDIYPDLNNYKDFNENTEEKIYLQYGVSRVTDTGINEIVMKQLDNMASVLWRDSNARKFPHEFLYEIAMNLCQNDCTGRLEDSWVRAAAENSLPIFVPGWEDSTLGNSFAALVYENKLDYNIIRGGIEYMIELIDWYKGQESVGFLQIGGGIAGDFPICVVPTLRCDLNKKDVPHWTYFCQFSDSTTSYGSYSGANPREKITWDKLSVGSPKFMIESDATICAPLLFQYVMDSVDVWPSPHNGLQIQSPS